MRYLLDTNTVSALMKNVPSVADRLRETHRADVVISQVTVAEVEYGLRHLPLSKRRRLLQAQWRAIGSEFIRIAWDDDVSRIFGLRKASLERSGMRMSDFDLAIAAHAIAHGMILVTSDAAFDRLGIRLENWLR